MTAATGTPGIVRVYWRPGCPFCTMLRMGLHRARLPVEEINIWEDPAAAAQVRHITGGDETVPVVVVGTRAMVNPTARQVVVAVRAGQPGLFLAQGHRLGSWLARAAGFLAGRRLRPGHAAREPSRHTPG